MGIEIGTITGGGGTTTLTLDATPNETELEAGNFVAGMEVSVKSESGGASTATITFTGNTTANQTITLVSNTMSVEYTSKETEDFTSQEFNGTTDTGTSAVSLADAINHTDGNNGEITAVRDGDTVTLTQVFLGAVFNGAITNNLSNSTVSDFTGGADADTARTTTAASWVANTLTVADGAGFDDGEVVYKVYEGVHGTTAEHCRKRLLGYI